MKKLLFVAVAVTFSLTPYA